LGHPSKFQRVSHLVFVTAATSLNGSQPNFARCFAVSWACTLYIHFCFFASLEIQDAKLTLKFVIWAPSHNFVGLYLCNECTHRQSEKNLLNSNISSTSPCNMVNVGLLTSEMDSLVWSTPANFNGFRVLASVLHRRRSPEANQTLHDVWPSHGLVHYVYIFGRSCPLVEFYQVQNSLCV